MKRNSNRKRNKKKNIFCQFNIKNLNNKIYSPKIILLIFIQKYIFPQIIFVFYDLYNDDFISHQQKSRDDAVQFIFSHQNFFIKNKNTTQKFIFTIKLVQFPHHLSQRFRRE